MSSHNFDDLSILKSFKGLQKGDNVYSKKYGLGQVYSPYEENQVIVQFSNLRKRISLGEKDVSKIPDKYSKKQRNRIEVKVDDQKISHKEYKRRRKIEKQSKKYKEVMQKSGKVLKKGKSDQFIFPF